MVIYSQCRPKQENKETAKEKKESYDKKDEDGKSVLESNQVQNFDKGKKEKSKACTNL